MHDQISRSFLRGNQEFKNERILALYRGSGSEDFANFCQLLPHRIDVDAPRIQGFRRSENVKFQRSNPRALASSMAV